MIDVCRRRAAGGGLLADTHAQAHLAAFAQTAVSYSYRRYLFNRWVSHDYHLGRLNLRWREHLSKKGR